MVPKPRLLLIPVSSDVTAGQSVELRAHAYGGEAMLFSVDWSIREGPAGGTISPQGARRGDGSLVAVYTAPTGSSGVFHVVATLHEFPTVQAEANMQVKLATSPR